MWLPSTKECEECRMTVSDGCQFTQKDYKVFQNGVGSELFVRKKCMTPVNRESVVRKECMTPVGRESVIRMECMTHVGCESLLRKLCMTPYWSGVGRKSVGCWTCRPCRRGVGRLLVVYSKIVWHFFESPPSVCRAGVWLATVNSKPQTARPSVHTVQVVHGVLFYNNLWNNGF